MIDQLPHDHQLEREILGASLANRGTAEAYALDHKIVDHAFTLDHHITLWRIIRHRLDHAKGPLDPHVLHDVLQRHPDLNEGNHPPDQVLATAATIADTTTGDGNAEHADRLLDLAERRRIIKVCETTIRAAQTPAQAPADILVDHDQNIASNDSLDGRPTRTLAEIVFEAIPIWEHPENRAGLKTGFTDLDRTLKGLAPGNLCVIGARPAMGKTAFAVDIAANAGRQGPVLFASLEMTDQEIGARYTARETSTPGHWLTHGEGRHGPETHVWDLINSVPDTEAAKQIHVIVRRGLQVTDCVRIAKRTHAKTPLSLVIVDYLQLLKPVDPKMPRHLAVAEMANELKTLAFDLACPVIALSQLNRECETRTNKRPLMSDLRESGDIEQTADQILLMYRDDYYNKDSPTPGVVEIDVTKNRHGGTGPIDLTFEGRYPRLVNSALAHQVATAPTAATRGPNHDLPLPTT